jgi:hypothetical protein
MKGIGKRPPFPAISLFLHNQTEKKQGYQQRWQVLENGKMREETGRDRKAAGYHSLDYPSILLSFLDSSFPYPLGNEKDSEKTTLPCITEEMIKKIAKKLSFPLSPHSPFPLFLMKK